MGKWTEKWKEKSERTLGKNRGKGIWLKMLNEKDKELYKYLLTKRKPIPDNFDGKETI